MPPNPVCWFDVYVQDMARAKAFYEAALGLQFQKLNTEHDMWAFPMAMEGYGAGGALVRMEGVPSGGTGTMVYFSCEDCAVEAARVNPAGGRVERPKFAIGEYGFIALARDTEGNMFGLHSLK